MLATAPFAKDKGKGGICEDGDDEEGGIFQEGLDHLGVPRGDEGNDEFRREGSQETYEKKLTVRGRLTPPFWSESMKTTPQYSVVYNFPSRLGSQL